MSERYPNIRRAQRAGGVYRRRPTDQRRGAEKQQASFLLSLAQFSALAAILSWNLAPELISAWSVSTSSPQALKKVESSVYYANCTEARAAGVAPIYRGSPGYREGMDGDGDGIACEPYRH